jgi:hypothetical protein
LTQEDAYLGDLLTNAKKVTVSVLYWYEKLSDLTIEIFKLILKRIKSFFVFFSIINARGRCELARHNRAKRITGGVRRVCVLSLG